MLPHSERKVEEITWETVILWTCTQRQSDQKRIYRGRRVSSFFPIQSATCSRSNHLADQLYSKEHLHPALVTSFFSWLKSTSKSSFIGRISGEVQYISAVQIITRFLLSTSTNPRGDREVEQLLLEAFSQHHGSWWASCDGVRSATCYLPGPGEFYVDLWCFSLRAAKHPFQTRAVSLKVWFPVCFVQRYCCLEDLSPPISNPPSQSTIHLLCQ